MPDLKLIDAQNLQLNTTRIQLDPNALANIANVAILAPRIIISQEPAKGVPVPVGSTVFVRMRSLNDISIEDAIGVQSVPLVLKDSTLTYVAGIRDNYDYVFDGVPDEATLGRFVVEYNAAAAKAGKPQLGGIADASALIGAVKKVTG